MKERPPLQKKYATAGNPTINAVIKSLFRFSSEQQAVERIQQLKDHFVTSKQTASPNTAIIWVRGFDVTEAETKQGVVGNYALISCKPMANRFTLTAEKIQSELKHHPQRKRPKQQHPDWGHPVLRGIKKKRLFATMEEAIEVLMRLHEEFPEVSIPAEARLMMIVYEKVDGVKSPVQKYKFEVKAQPDGTFMIDYKRNTKAPRPAAPPAPPKEATENGGYFSSMVRLQRKKKVRPGAAAATPAATGQTPEPEAPPAAQE